LVKISRVKPVGTPIDSPRDHAPTSKSVKAVSQKASIGSSSPLVTAAAAVPRHTVLLSPYQFMIGMECSITRGSSSVNRPGIANVCRETNLPLTRFTA